MSKTMEDLLPYNQRLEKNAKDLCKVKAPMITGVLEWSLNNFRKITEVQKSSEITIGNTGVKFYLLLYPNDKQEKGRCTVELKCTPEVQKLIGCYWICSPNVHPGSPECDHSLCGMYNLLEESKKSPDFLQVNSKSEGEQIVQHQDILHLCCKVGLISSFLEHSLPTEILPDLLDSRSSRSTERDSILWIPGYRHKFRRNLQGMPDVFKAMLEINKNLKIALNVDLEVMQKIFDYFLTSSVGEVKTFKEAFQILQVAEMYSLYDVNIMTACKGPCTLVEKVELTNDNAIIVFSVASIMNRKSRLCTSAIYKIANIDPWTLIETDHYKSFIKPFPRLKKELHTQVDMIRNLSTKP